VRLFFMTEVSGAVRPHPGCALTRLLLSFPRSLMDGCGVNSACLSGLHQIGHNGSARFRQYSAAIASRGNDGEAARSQSTARVRTDGFRKCEYRVFMGVRMNFSVDKGIFL